MGSQTNGVASLKLRKKRKFRPAEASVLERVKFEWRRKGYKTNAITAGEDLYRNLIDLITEHPELIQEKSDAEADLISFLKNKDEEFAIDDCVRWCLLSITVENPDEQTTSLSKILVQNQPYLAFIPTVKGVIPGESAETSLVSISRATASTLIEGKGK